MAQTGQPTFGIGGKAHPLRGLGPAHRRLIDLLAVQRDRDRAAHLFRGNRRRDRLGRDAEF